MDVPVVGNMDQWIKHAGYPVLTVTEEINTGTILVEQSRFLNSSKGFQSSSLILGETADQELWWVPLGIKTGMDAAQGRDTRILDKEKRCDRYPVDLTFYKLNDSSAGVFRVNYPAKRLEILGKQVAIGDKRINGSDRISLVADAHALAISGTISTSEFLALIENFTLESNLFVWEELLHCLSQLRSAWYEQPEHIKNGLRAFSRKLISGKLGEIGWDAKPTESYLTSQLRPLLLKQAAFAGIHQSHQCFNNLLSLVLVQKPRDDSTHGSMVISLLYRHT